MEPVRHLTHACRDRRARRDRRWTAVAGALLLAVSASAAGCFTDERPTQVMVTQVAADLKAAKPPDCEMPVLVQEPAASYRQIAIVEAWSDVNADPAKVVPELKRKACETGADALLILGGKKQSDKKLLYSVTPNQTETAVTSQNRSPNQAGDYINKMQYTPRMGEGGHVGYYIDAIAIDYQAGSSTADAAGQPPPKP